MQNDGIVKAIIHVTFLLIYVYQQNSCLPFNLSSKNMTSNNLLCIYYLSFKDMLNVLRVTTISMELI